MARLLFLLPLDSLALLSLQSTFSTEPSGLLEPTRVVELAVAAERGVAACLREHCVQKPVVPFGGGRRRSLLPREQEKKRRSRKKEEIHAPFNLHLFSPLVQSQNPKGESVGCRTRGGGKGERERRCLRRRCAFRASRARESRLSVAFFFLRSRKKMNRGRRAQKDHTTGGGGKNRSKKK